MCGSPQPPQTVEIGCYQVNCASKGTADTSPGPERLSGSMPLVAELHSWTLVPHQRAMAWQSIQICCSAQHW